MFGAETIQPQQFLEISNNFGFYVDSAILSTNFKVPHSGLDKPTGFTFKFGKPNLWIIS